MGCREAAPHVQFPDTNEVAFLREGTRLRNETPLNVGVVGAGFIAGTIHIPFLKKISFANVEAIADVDLEKAQKLSTAHGIPLVTADYRELLRNERISVIDICTPPSTHATIINDAAIAGKQIIVEKPLAVRLGEAFAIREKLSETGVALGVVLNLRYMPLVRKIPRILHGGQLGQVTNITTTLHTFPPSSDWVTHSPFAECGVLYDFFPHVIDVVTWSLQAMPSKVLCVTAESGKHHAFHLIIELRLPSGRTCVMHADLKWTNSTSLRLLRFGGDRRDLFVDLQDQFCQLTSGYITPPKRVDEFVRRMVGVAKRVAKGPASIRNGAMIYHQDLLRDFLGDFRRKRGPKISIVDGLMHMAVIDAAITSKIESRVVEIDHRVLL